MDNQLVGKYKKLAADKFGNHGCNDLDPSLFEGWTDAEKVQLIKDFELYNCGHLDDLEEPISPDYLYMGDSGLMGFFAQMLRTESDLKPGNKEQTEIKIILGLFERFMPKKVAADNYKDMAMYEAYHRLIKMAE